MTTNSARGRAALSKRVSVVGRKGKALAADVTETGFLKAAVGFEIRFMHRTVTRRNGHDVCANFKR